MIAPCGLAGTGRRVAVGRGEGPLSGHPPDGAALDDEPDFLWLTPLANVVLFVCAGMFMGLVDDCGPGRVNGWAPGFCSPWPCCRL